MMQRKIKIEYKIKDLEGSIKDEFIDAFKIIIVTQEGDQHIYEIEKVEDIQMSKIY